MKKTNQKSKIYQKKKKKMKIKKIRIHFLCLEMKTMKKRKKKVYLEDYLIIKIMNKALVSYFLKIKMVHF